MDEYRTRGMSEALRLTRAGKLPEAFAALQRTLVPQAGGRPASRPLTGLPRRWTNLLGDLSTASRSATHPGAAAAAAAPGG